MKAIKGHSPLPWMIHVFHTSTGERQTLNCVGKSMSGRDWSAYVKTADGTSVLETDGATSEEALANAGIVVAAVNEREQLREALRGVAIMLNSELKEYESEPWAQRVRAVLNEQGG